jgi:hypothetical protein
MMESSPNLLSERIPLTAEGDGFTRMKSQLLVVCRSSTLFRTTRTTPGQSVSTTIQFRTPRANSSSEEESNVKWMRRSEKDAGSLTGEARRLRVSEHGGEAGEAVPVAVENGVPRRLLAAKSQGRLSFQVRSEVVISNQGS